MPRIHPLAAVDESAVIADDVVIGPFSYVEANVTIGEGCRLDSHSTLKANTFLGRRNYVGQGTVLGGDPQDRKYKGELTFLKIGDDNVFREYVTVHRATGEGRYTTIGNDNYVMAYSHFGHNVTFGDHITVANGVNVAGHVTVEDHVVLGGMSGLHQFVRVGTVAMVGGMSRISKDAPPYMLTEGENEVLDINAVGLRRFGITSEARMGLHKACKLLFKSQLGLRNAMDIVRREVPMTPELQYLLEFEARRAQGKNGRSGQP